MYRIILRISDGDHFFSSHKDLQDANNVLNKMTSEDFLSKVRDAVNDPGLSPALRFARIQWLRWLEEAVRAGVGVGIILYEDQ